MSQTMREVMHPGSKTFTDARFPDSPPDWHPDAASQTAKQEGMAITEAHWEVVRALQRFYARHEGSKINARELHDALDEKFHGKGGLRYLYTLFPGGPVAQGCRLAGLEPPAGATDRGFGSAV